MTRRGFDVKVVQSTVPVRWTRRVDALGPLFRTAREFLRALNRLGPGDVAFLVRLEKMPGIFPGALALARKRGFRLVYDIDEAIYLRNPLPTVGLIRFADGVIVASRPLEDAVRRWNPNVVRVHTPVEMELYPEKTDYESDPVVVGFAGTPSNLVLLTALAAPLAVLRRKHRIELRLVTGPDVNVPDILPGGQRVVPWNLATYRAEIARFDVGVMVVEDSPWWRAKMGFKLAEYQACGVPCVGSRVLSASRPLLEGQTGWYAGSPEEWRARLESLVASAALRAQMGRRARAWANEEFSLTKAGRLLEAFVTSL